MEKKQFVQDLKTKDVVHSVFIVKYIALMESRDGKSYLNVVLSDSTGDIECRKWQNAVKVVEQISRGDYVSVQGKINFFQNRLQLIISEIELCSEDELNRDHFISKSMNDSDKMFDELIEIAESLTDVYIKDLIKIVLFDSEINRRIKVWSAGKSIHHNYEAGLLEHIYSCTKLAVMLSDFYKADINYVVAGAILHDIGKVYELSDGVLVEYTEEGKLLGHLVKSLELLDRYAAKISNFPYDTKVHLKHILASHHGQYEHGSPKLPQTTEALILYHIDFIDSKVNSFEVAKKQDNILGNWTGYIKHLNRVIFKGELPHYDKYIKVSDSESLIEDTKNKNLKSPDKDLKYSLADKLKNFKVD